jgi:hypothetical protein
MNREVGNQRARWRSFTRILWFPASADECSLAREHPGSKISRDHHSGLPDGAESRFDAVAETSEFADHLELPLASLR